MAFQTHHPFIYSLLIIIFITFFLKVLFQNHLPTLEFLNFSFFNLRIYIKFLLCGGGGFGVRHTRGLPKRRKPHTSHYLSRPVATKKRPTTYSTYSSHYHTRPTEKNNGKTTQPTLLVELQRYSVPRNSTICNRFLQTHLQCSSGVELTGGSMPTFLKRYFVHSSSIMLKSVQIGWS